MAYCGSCGAEILWGTTEKGRPIPLDAKPEKRFVLINNIMGERLAKVENTYLSHFATCPDADQHRKPKVAS